MIASSHTSVPASRIRVLVDQSERSGGSFVLYWMVGSRRVRHNFALQHAACRAEALGLPLLVVEALRVDYPWACDRFHQFALDGMRDNQEAFAGTPVRYYPYLEPTPGAASGMLPAFARSAALLVSDDTPVFFLPRMLQAAARQIAIRFECVDSCGLYPVGAATRTFTTAASFRRHLQKELPAHLAELPETDPIADRELAPMGALSQSLCQRWPETPLPASKNLLADLPIDHKITATAIRGGPVAARQALARFVRDTLPNYGTLRNQPAADGQSGLSPYLHFGHIASSEVFLAIAEREDWSPARLAERATGSRRGWWGMRGDTEDFLDQLITWRELGYNGAAHLANFDSYPSLPAWARASLDAHARDPRPHLYTEEELENACTHDAIWNAAQTQLVREGRIHNYLRMLWGKKILEWSPTPQLAAKIMIELNDKYALDGRDPNSYSGIFWVLGRYDRAWGPEREIFGKIRYMSSANTSRKFRLRGYLERYGGS